MSIAFSRSMRSFAADGFCFSMLGLLLAVILLGLWFAWFFLAKVTLYEVSDTARLVNAVYPVESSIAGRVVATRLVLGKEVQVGDVLVELDANTQRLQLKEERARYREAKAQVQLANEVTKRFARLHEMGIVSDIDLLRARAEVQKHQTEVDTLAATIKRLEYETEKCLIRASITGRLGEIANLEIGMVIREGDKVGAIVPQGKLKVIAYFFPQAALGRIQPGQPAWLRLYGFPWTQYGSISATVMSVASEAQDGRVQVELMIHPNPASPIPFQHGLLGTVEVEVDHASPAALVLRIAGKHLGVHRTANKDDRKVGQNG